MDEKNACISIGRKQKNIRNIKSYLKALSLKSLGFAVNIPTDMFSFQIVFDIYVIQKLFRVKIY